MLRALQVTARQVSGQQPPGSSTVGRALGSLLEGVTLGAMSSSRYWQDPEEQRVERVQPVGGKQALKVLSVNIDAEEGEDILKQLCKLVSLEDLLVDATDEFDFDPGFQPYDNLTNLQKLVVTMPMSLANTQSLQACSNLRELHLITLPSMPLREGSLEQLTQLELLQAPRPKAGTKTFGPFPNVQVMVIREGADDVTLSTLGKSMLSLRRLELYKLPLGYTQGGIQALAHLPELRELLLELAQSGAVAESWLEQVPGVALATSAMHMVGGSGQEAAGARALSAFVPPPVGFTVKVLPQVLTGSHSSGWFPQLRRLSLLGHVVASDHDLMHLTHLRQLQGLLLHVTGPKSGWFGGAGLSEEGVWQLVGQLEALEEVQVLGASEIHVKVPGRMPGIYV